MVQRWPSSSSSDLSTPLSNLRTLLDAYEAAPEERDAVAATLKLIAAGAETFRDDYFEPGHVTASGLVLDTTRTRLLLIHHRNLGTWLQPGGHVDPGEDVLAAALREVHEETGVAALPVLDAMFDLDVHLIPPSRGRPAHHHYDIRFLLGTNSDELVLSDEVMGVRWVPFDEVAAISTDESVVRAADKVRSWLA